MKKVSKYEKLQNKYSQFFTTEYRMGTEKGSKIKILKHDKTEEFFTVLIADQEISDSIKLAVILQWSGAMRISETLELKVNQIDIQSRMINAIRVLKKRTNMVKRDLRMPVVVMKFVEKQLKYRKADETIISFSRRYALKVYTQYLGICTHALRHSRVSYFINHEELKMNPVEVCQLMEWNSTDVAKRYMHVNKAPILAKL